MVAGDAVSCSCEFLSHTMRKILFCHRGLAGFIFTHAHAVTLIITENRNACVLTAYSSLSPRERAGGKGRCAPCAHTVAPKGPYGSWHKAPHPNPLPEGRGAV